MASPAPPGVRGTTHVCFSCQRCSQPLKLEASFQALGRAQANELMQNLGAETPLDEVVARAAAEDVDRVIKRLQSPNSLGNLFERREQSTAGSDPGTSSLHVSTEVARRLFDIMSQRTAVDHPLCDECTDVLLDELDVVLRATEAEARECSEFLQAHTDGDPAPLLDAAALQAELGGLEAEQAMLLEKLAAVQLQQGQLGEEADKQAAESLELQASEDRYWKEYNEYQRQLEDFRLDESTVRSKYSQVSAQLEGLKKTNVFNDAFHIWHDGHFGTINGFRLGRLPSVPVDWNEINAAWGQTLLLLHTMASRLNFTFERYRLLPGGSHSKIQRVDEPGKFLPLHGSGGFKLFWDSKFDSAMAGFLDCLLQFKDHVESKDPHFKLPYRIDKDKIGDSHGDASIRIQFNQEETWTKALKYMLTNLKWCLAWVCKQMG